jgi:hypothetical protein
MKLPCDPSSPRGAWPRPGQPVWPWRGGTAIPSSTLAAADAATSIDPYGPAAADAVDRARAVSRSAASSLRSKGLVR